jgi:predicted dinucleotide-binding enzyme
MTTVGLIGSGHIGITVAQLAIEAGHQVVLSNSRGPETLTDAVAQLGPRASAATSEQAAAAGDIVVITVPVKAFPNLPAAPLAGKTVIDTCNYGPERDGHIPELDSNALTSSELLLRYIPDAMLVKAFNNIYYQHLLSLARPAGAADRSFLPIAGNSERAKAAVSGFIDSIGYNVVDAGPLADSWRQATGTPVWGTPYGPYSNEKGRPVSEDVIRAALATRRGNRKVGAAANSIWSTKDGKPWPGPCDRTISVVGARKRSSARQQERRSAVFRGDEA